MILTPEELEQLSAADIQQALMEDRGSVFDAAGIRTEEFQQLSPQAREMVEAAINEPEPEPEPDEFEAIEVPVDSEVARLAEAAEEFTVSDYSRAGQELIQAEFLANHPDYIMNDHNGNALRDRVASYGDHYFSHENLDKAFEELTAESAFEEWPRRSR